MGVKSGSNLLDANMIPTLSGDANNNGSHIHGLICINQYAWICSGFSFSENDTHARGVGGPNLGNSSISGTTFSYQTHDLDNRQLVSGAGSHTHTVSITNNDLHPINPQHLSCYIFKRTA